MTRLWGTGSRGKVILLETAREFPSPRSPLRPLTLYTMLVLAYCAGLRLGELARLDLRNVSMTLRHPGTLI